ncbi:MAG: VOC family protein [Acidimicrobiales bacterium]|jgi:catechol-2,3-dioxygenase|nr:VOC family protein [Acidimicrobiales bacterium]
MSTSPSSPTLGLRHAVLWESDPAASARFYEQALGLEIKAEMGDAVFMSSPGSATDHDLGLFRTADPTPPPSRGLGLYHLAWEVATLAELDTARERLSRMGALVGASNHHVSRSLYAKDPDGIEFKVMWEILVDQLTDGGPTTKPLDLDAAIAEFGADSPGRGASERTGA